MLTHQELLGAIARGWCSGRNERKTMDPELAEDIARAIEQAVNAKKKSDVGWRNLDEHMPEPEKFVLTWDGKKVGVDWWGGLRHRGDGVTHWMPFATPPGSGPMYCYEQAVNAAGAGYTQGYTDALNDCLRNGLEWAKNWFNAAAHDSSNPTAEVGESPAVSCAAAPDVQAAANRWVVGRVRHRNRRRMDRSRRRSFLPRRR